MGAKVIQDSTLSAIGNAIREKQFKEREIVKERFDIFSDIHLDKNEYVYEFTLPQEIIDWIIYKKDRNEQAILYYFENYEKPYEYAERVLALTSTTASITTVYKADYEYMGFNFAYLGYNNLTTDTVFRLRETTNVPKVFQLYSKEYLRSGESSLISPLEMDEAILQLPTLSRIRLTGNLDYLFYRGYFSSFMEMVDTYSVASATYMFSGFKEESTKNFEVNFTTGLAELGNFLSSASNVTSDLPIIRAEKFGNINGLFSGCYRLREIPDNYITVQNGINNSCARMFENCYSLRKVPEFWININSAATSYSSLQYYYGLYKCRVLDEVINVPVPTNSFSSASLFSSFIAGCNRLKRFTFVPNKTAKIKSASLDFSDYVGYCPTAEKANLTTSYNSGITTDKEVTDAESYNRLKNDADWFSADINYSRYNHDSAVETINSLPDTSAYGTNTIKFKGAAGALTDGGAINTLTSAEIAVASAKGWTVTLA